MDLEAEVVHRQYPIINQFAIVDINYKASGKVNLLTWLDLKQLRTIVFIYYPETYHLFVLNKLSHWEDVRVIIQEQ